MLDRDLLRGAAGSRAAKLPFGIANMMAGSAFVVGPVARRSCPIVLQVQESQQFRKGGDGRNFIRYLGGLL